MIKAQDGTKLPTAPKAEIRYQNGVKDSVAYLGVPFKDSSYFGESIKRVKTPENASIERRILFRHYPYDNDTTYTEIPEHSKYKMYPIKTKVQPRQATNSDVKYVKRNKNGFISYIPTTPSDEYATLKRRFDTAWGVAKHEEGGPVEKSDNTRVNKIPNKGEGVYEATPQGVGDILPFVGTYRAAKRIDNGEPNASYKDLFVNGAMDLLGTGMVGSVVKAAGKAKRIHQALKANGFRLVGREPTKFIKTRNRTILSRGYMNPDKYYHINLGPEVIAKKTIPNVDYYNVAMQPMIQSLRVPAIAIDK